MANGKKLTLENAVKMIRAFETQEKARPNYSSGDLAIGQLFDLSLFIDFMKAINDHEKSEEINGIRVYLAKSERDLNGVSKVLYDVVLVPVLKNGVDLHKVYNKEAFVDGGLPTLIGNGLPCPNVCPNGTLLCE